MLRPGHGTPCAYKNRCECLNVNELRFDAMPYPYDAFTSCTVVLSGSVKKKSDP